jgi:hypothetical protein
MHQASHEACVAWVAGQPTSHKGIIMEKPIEAGCKAVVINGLLGEKSPNIGLVVRVKQYVGDEITLGRIWRCEAEYGERIQERAHIPPGLVDFAQSWLKRLPDDPLLGQSQETKKELTV